jgi:LysM domain-containing protein
MHPRSLSRTSLALCLSAALLATWHLAGTAGGTSFEIDLNELPREKRPSAPPHKRTAPAKAKRGVRAAEPAAGGQTRYTVKPGDHLYKILIKEFGLSNSQAEALIPTILKLNNIPNIKGLHVGQTILIPSSPAPSAASHTRAKRTAEKSAAKPAAVVAAGEAAPATSEAADFIPPAKPKVEPLVKEVPLNAPLPPVTPAAVEIHVLTVTDPAEIVDKLLELIDLPATKNRIVESGRESSDGTYISIKVDRFFTNRGTDYIVAIGVTDPFNFTMLRLLEVAGTQVVTLQAGEPFRSVVSKILDKLQWPYSYGKHRLKLSGDQETEVDGFMLVTGGATSRQLLLTDVKLAKGGDQTAAPASGGMTPR